MPRKTFFKLRQGRKGSFKDLLETPRDVYVTPDTNASIPEVASAALQNLRSSVRDTIVTLEAELRGTLLDDNAEYSASMDSEARGYHQQRNRIHRDILHARIDIETRRLDVIEKELGALPTRSDVEQRPRPSLTACIPFMGGGTAALDCSDDEEEDGIVKRDDEPLCGGVEDLNVSGSSRLSWRSGCSHGDGQHRSAIDDEECESSRPNIHEESLDADSSSVKPRIYDYYPDEGNEDEEGSRMGTNQQEDEDDYNPFAGVKRMGRRRRSSFPDSADQLDGYMVDLVTLDPQISEMTLLVDNLERAQYQLAVDYRECAARDGRQGILDALVDRSMGMCPPPPSTSYVDRALKWENSPLSKNVSRYVNLFSGSPESADVLALDMRRFIQYTADKLHREAPQGSSTRDVETVLENHILPLLYNKCMSVVSRPAEDAELLARCNKYEHLTQERLGMPEKLWSTELMPYAMSIANLRAMYYAKTPAQKLSAILSAVQSIYSSLIKKGRSPEGIGADEFMECWVYVCIQARIPNLETNLQYVQTFGTDEIMMAEGGYYFTSLAAAANYIRKELNPVINVDCLPFVVFERERFKEWCEKFPSVQVGVDMITLTGYKLLCVEDWLDNNESNYSTILLPTQNENDKVLGSVLNPSSSISADDASFVKSLFFHPSIPYVATEKTRFGSILVGIESKFPKDLRYIEVPNGDFDGHAEDLRDRIQYYSLGIIDSTSMPVTNEDHERLCDEYGVAKGRSATKTAKKLVTEVQVTLSLLDYAAFFSSVNGRFNGETTTAMVGFQRDVNDSVFSHLGVHEGVRSDGMLSASTLNSLRTVRTCLHAQLEALGYHFSGDVVLQHAQFTKVITKFQEDKGVYVNGRLGRNSIARLQELMRDRGLL